MWSHSTVLISITSVVTPLQPMGVVIFMSNLYMWLKKLHEKAVGPYLIFSYVYKNNDHCNLMNVSNTCLCGWLVDSSFAVQVHFYGLWTCSNIYDLMTSFNLMSTAECNSSLDWIHCSMFTRTYFTFCDCWNSFFFIDTWTFFHDFYFFWGGWNGAHSFLSSENSSNHTVTSCSAYR